MTDMARFSLKRDGSKAIIRAGSDKPNYCPTGTLLRPNPRDAETTGLGPATFAPTQTRGVVFGIVVVFHYRVCCSGAALHHDRPSPGLGQADVVFDGDGVHKRC